MSFQRSKVVTLLIGVFVVFLSATTLSQAQASNYYIPLTVDGGGYRTLFTVTNLSASSTAQFSIQLSRDSGSARQDANVLNVPGQNGGQSGAALNVPAGGQVTLSTIGGNPLFTGWALVSSASNVGVSAVFLVIDGNGNVTSAVGIIPQASQATVSLVGLINPSAKTGFAVLNPSPNATANLSFQFFDSTGAQVSTTKTTTLAPGSRLQIFFDQAPLFTDLSNVQGTVALTSDTPLQVLTLRLDFPSGALSALPNLPGRSGNPIQVQHADATFSWIDATPTGGGARLAIGGDHITGDVNGQTTSISFPFSITFYGVSYGDTLFNQMWISENGWISFQNATSFASSAPPAALPSATAPPALVAPFFADLHYNANNTSVGVFTKVDGTAPSRRFTIEWSGVSFVNPSLGTTATFEVIFFEGTSDIKFQYQVVGSSPSGPGIVVGIQDATQTQAKPVNLSTNPPAANTAKAFQYFGGSSYTLVQ